MVEREGGSRVGAPAVIDKDCLPPPGSSGQHRRVLRVHGLGEGLFNFQKPDQGAIERIAMSEAERHLREVQFAPRSRKPKMQAVAEYLRDRGRQALVMDPSHIIDAFAGKGRTRVVP